MKPASPFYTAAEAAAFLKFPSVRAFYRFRARHDNQPRATRRGSTLLFTEADLRRVLDDERPAHRLKAVAQ